MTVIHKEEGRFRVEEAVQGKNLLSDAEVTNTSSSNAVTVNWNSCQYQNVTTNEDTTISFTDPASTGFLGLKLIITGTRTLTWPGAVVWEGSSSPTVMEAGTYMIFFYFDGTNYNALGRFTIDGSVNIVGSLLTDEVFIPISWAEDGSSPPAITELITSGNGSVRVRKFDSGSVEDVVIPWEVPSDIDASVGIAFSVMGVITEATAPAAGEGVSFKMSGYSIGVGDSINGAFGVEVESKDADLNASGVDTQYDRFKTALSGTITVTNLAAGELAMLHFERDTADADDDYGQDVGVYGILIQYTRILT